ncbi:hypothetical protein F7Q99_05390 [Streptomyces kaniharaensis]|uniref:Uncharacterized protein n=1 Tax=Streptomyces kaniharaensis TaxID=212423 RepID=A0A6N7KMZ5_9ACTN|nr:hypothetical protein [Streptomyces kaniharaensis]
MELVELGRFFTIAARLFDTGQAAPQMFSTAIDVAWHRLLEDPEAYTAFTTRHAGRCLGHSPVRGQGFISWVTAYKEAYGPLPQIWFTGADGTVDTKALARYRQTGRVWAEWDCSPVPGDGDVVPEKTPA